MSPDSRRRSNVTGAFGRDRITTNDRNPISLSDYDIISVPVQSVVLFYKTLISPPYRTVPPLDPLSPIDTSVVRYLIVWSVLPAAFERDHNGLDLLTKRPFSSIKEKENTL